jgi:hypothetical protein
MVIREIGKKLTVDVDAGLCERSHKLRIGRPILAGGGIYADDPERAELALADAAVAECKLAGFIDMMLGYGKNITAHSPKAFGGFEYFLFSPLGSG